MQRAYVSTRKKIKIKGTNFPRKPHILSNILKSWLQGLNFRSQKWIPRNELKQRSNISREGKKDFKRK